MFAGFTVAVSILGTMATWVSGLLYSYLLTPLWLIISPFVMPILTTFLPWLPGTAALIEMASYSIGYAIVNHILKPVHNFVVEKMLNPTLEFLKPCTNFLYNQYTQLKNFIKRGLASLFGYEIKADAPPTPDIEMQQPHSEPAANPEEPATLTHNTYMLLMARINNLETEMTKMQTSKDVKLPEPETTSARFPNGKCMRPRRDFF